MGFREIANADLSMVVEDRDTGFGWDIAVRDPGGKEESLVGLSSDISQVIDPDTGMVVSGRMASIAITISSLEGVGFTSLPRGISDAGGKPWIIIFDDIGGSPHTFKVQKSNPDRAIGLVTCYLEGYSE